MVVTTYGIHHHIVCDLASRLGFWKRTLALITVSLTCTGTVPKTHQSSDISHESAIHRGVLCSTSWECLQSFSFLVSNSKQHPAWKKV